MLTDLWNRLIAWTGTLVSPDWAALVALIPLLLALVVVAFLVITAVKWSNAGPARRGPGPRPPLAPDGTPLRGPSAAPMAVAAGAFVLAFGLVGGGPWLPAGIVLTVIGLAWWALDLRRGAAPRAITEARTPMSGDEPNAHGRALFTPVRVGVVGVVVLLVMVVAATAKVVPDAPGASQVPPVPSDTYQGSPPAADVTLVAQNITFAPTALTAPAGRSFTVAFDNREKVPHNLEVRDSAGKSLFLGDIITGPKLVVYILPSLPAGQYPFVCTVHPAMTGTLTVK